MEGSPRELGTRGITDRGNGTDGNRFRDDTLENVQKNKKAAPGAAVHLPPDRARS